MGQETEPEVGDQASWNYGGGAPAGTVAEIAQHGELAIETQHGNTVKKNADPDNPGLRIERSGNDVVKRASEVAVGKKGSGSKEAGGKDDKNEQSGGDSLEAVQEGAEADTAGDPEGTEDEGEEDEEFLEGYETGASDEDSEEVNESEPLEVNASGREAKKGGKVPGKKQKEVQEVGADDEQDAEGEVVKDDSVEIVGETKVIADAQPTQDETQGRKRKAASVSESKTKEIVEGAHVGKRQKNQSIS